MIEILHKIIDKLPIHDNEKSILHAELDAPEKEGESENA